ncbi:MAG TPA: dodecin family protein [Gammaproteobacteria bacterium]|nr:dodecin family protein [Gammaproteobacteria bacterium]HET7587673.1 dodecin family protein [Gammaproteobacteria bacterium]
MPIAKSVEISAESKTSFEDALKEGAKTACNKLDKVQSIWVKDQEVKVSEDGSITDYRVWMKVTFELK